MIGHPAVRPPGHPVAVKEMAPPAVAAPAWVEPVDTVAAPPRETGYPAAIEAASLPDWARRPIATAAEGPIVAVRRIPIASDTSDVATLREALDRNGGVIEISDDGPFFEDDLRIAGKARLIRARPGFRPMIVIGPSATPDDGSAVPRELVPGVAALVPKAPPVTDMCDPIDPIDPMPPPRANAAVVERPMQRAAQTTESFFMTRLLQTRDQRDD